MNGEMQKTITRPVGTVIRLADLENLFSIGARVSRRPLSFKRMGVFAFAWQFPLKIKAGFCCSAFIIN